MVVKSVERRVDWCRCAVVVVALHHTVGNPKGESGVGRNGCAVDVEPSAAEGERNALLLLTQVAEATLKRSKTLQKGADQLYRRIGHGQRPTAKRLDGAR